MNTLASSRVAEVSLFSSGMVFAFFHLFLRVNATRMVIKPMGESSNQPKQKRPRIRFFGPSDLEMNISGPMALQGGHRPDSRQGLIDVGPEKNRYDFEPEYFARPEKPLSPGSIRSNGPIDPSKWPLPPHPVQSVYFNQPDEGTTGLHKRNKSNYSLFPTRAEDVPRLPATVYTPPSQGGESRFSRLAMRRQTRRSSIGAKSVTDVSEAFSFLTKPPPLFSPRHNRNESTDSSATVQIGLRFSVAPATLAAAKCTRAERSTESSGLRAPPLQHTNTDESGVSLGLPIQSPTSATSEKFPDTPVKSSAFPVTMEDSSAYLQSQREKIILPTPRRQLPGPPPPAQAPMPLQAGMSGLRMNPVSPASTIDSPSTPGTPATPTSPPRSRSNSPSDLSPSARIPLGAGTMARSPPPNGWI